MKPQPLSGKAEKICFEDKRGPCFYKEDVESAVNWLKAKLENGIWHVSGSLPKGSVKGGVAVAEISKSDGRIIRVSHGK